MGDPIYVNSGAFGYALPLLHLGGPLPLDYSLNYRTDGSWMALGVPMDPNSPAHFQHSIFPNVEYWPAGSSGASRIYLETMRPGELLCFQLVSGSWVQQEASPIRYVLLRTASGSFWLMDPAAERIYLFEPYSAANGFRILAYMDRNENRWTYSYSGNTTILPSRLEDGLGRVLQFAFASTPAFELRRALTGVTDQSGRTISFESTPLAYYSSVTDPAGRKTTFAFDGSKYLTQVTRPLGNAPYRQAYANASLNGVVERRTVSQTDALGATTSLAYDATSNRVTVTNPDRTTQVFRSFGNNASLQSITDAAGRQTTFTQTSYLQPSGSTDRLGNRTSLTYHQESGKALSITNARGKTTSFSYTAQDQVFTNPKTPGETVTFRFYNLSRIDYPDGTNEQFTYDARGNCTQHRNQKGAVTTFTYNSRGQVLTAQNPAGGTATYAWNADGTLASRGDSDTSATTIAYDRYLRPSQANFPDGSSIRYAYDLTDRLTSVTDGRGNATSYSFDDNGNLVRVTDALGKTVQYAYDQMDRVVAVTNKSGKTSRTTYDSMGRIASVTGPTGISRSYEYDTRGWLVRATQGQQSTRWEYDNEGSLISTTLPSGAVVRRGVDPLGRSSSLTSATGGVTTFARSEMDRVTAVTDPLNRITRYGYDAQGVLTDVTLADNSTARYERTTYGWLSRITDGNSRDWAFTRSPMGRPRSGTDPLSQTRQYRYDNLGRLNQVTYPSGDTFTVARDLAGNATRLQYLGGPDLTFTYDALNRVTGAGELQLTYDSDGRIATTSDSGIAFGVTRDDTGRVASAAYANGAFSVNYTYDASTGLLTKVQDTLTQSQVQFSYDADRHLVGIARSNGVNSVLTYDAASRLTGIRDGKAGSSPAIEIQATINAAGRVAAMRLTAPLNPALLLKPQLNVLSYDAASQIASPGYRYDDRGRLVSDGSRTYSWDGASRLTGTGEAILTYDSFGELRTRTAGTKTIRYFGNKGLRLSPVVAEQDAASLGFLRYFVWTPGGKLLYMIDAADGNRVYYFHPDRSGSILALTDAAGNVTDSYAYTPHGKLLQHQGSLNQPFTYMGYWGVRQEGESGTLFQMRARYYDAVSGRFLTREPMWPNLADPRQLNPYAYAGNDPNNFGDITGLDPVPTDLHRWEIFWLEDGIVHSAFGTYSGAAAMLLPGLGLVAPPAPAPSAVQARWIAEAGGNSQAFNKIVGMIASQLGYGTAGTGMAGDTGLITTDPYLGLAGYSYGNNTYGLPLSPVDSAGPSTFGSLNYLLHMPMSSQGSFHDNFVPLSSSYDYGSSTYNPYSYPGSAGPYTFGSFAHLMQNSFGSNGFLGQWFNYDYGPTSYGSPFSYPGSVGPYTFGTPASGPGSFYVDYSWSSYDYMY